MRAMVDILQADYFLVLNDYTPDSRENGYADDAEVVHRAFVKHEAELRAFEEWLPRSVRGCPVAFHWRRELGNEVVPASGIEPLTSGL